MQKFNSSKKSQEIIQNLIIENYDSNLNLSQLHEKICKITYVNIRNIADRLKKLNLPLKETRGSISKLTFNPFEIGLPNNEYWLGFFLADGHLGKTSRDGIFLFNTEVNHLRGFHLHAKVKLSEYIRKAANKDMLCIYFGDKNTYLYLSNLGVVPDKRYGCVCNFDITWAMLLGIFDGDGSVRNRKSLEWKITSGNKQLLDKISHFLQLEGFKTSFVKKGKNCHDLYLLGNNNSKILFLEKLYSSNNWFLKYKFDKICALISKDIKDNCVNCWETLRDKLTTRYPEMESVNV